MARRAMCTGVHGNTTWNPSPMSFSQAHRPSPGGHTNSPTVTSSVASSVRTVACAAIAQVWRVRAVALARSCAIWCGGDRLCRARGGGVGGPAGSTPVSPLAGRRVGDRLSRPVRRDPAGRGAHRVRAALRPPRRRRRGLGAGPHHPRARPLVGRRRHPVLRVRRGRHPQPRRRGCACLGRERLAGRDLAPRRRTVPRIARAADRAAGGGRGRDRPSGRTPPRRPGPASRPLRRAVRRPPLPAGLRGGRPRRHRGRAALRREPGQPADRDRLAVVLRRGARRDAGRLPDTAAQPHRGGRLRALRRPATGVARQRVRMAAGVRLAARQGVARHATGDPLGAARAVRDDRGARAHRAAADRRPGGRARRRPGRAARGRPADVLHRSSALAVRCRRRRAPGRDSRARPRPDRWRRRPRLLPAAVTVDAARDRSPAARSARAAIVDADIHNTWPEPAALDPYLPERWRRLRARLGERLHPGAQYPRLNPAAARTDAWPPEGGLPGSSLDLMRDQLLDRWSIERGILNPLLEAGELLNLEYGAAFAQAINDWQVAEWLEPEPRLRASITVPYEDAPLAVA